MHILEASLVARNEDGSVDIRRLGEQASSAFYPLFYVEGLQAAVAVLHLPGARPDGRQHVLRGHGRGGRRRRSAAATGRPARRGRRGARGRLRRRQLVVEHDQVRGARRAEPRTSGACRPYDGDARRHRARRGRGLPRAREPEERRAARGARVLRARSPASAAPYDTHALITPRPGRRARSRAGDRGRAARGRRDAGATSATSPPTAAARVDGDAQRGARARAGLRRRRRPARSAASRPATGHLVGARRRAQRRRRGARGRDAARSRRRSSCERARPGVRRLDVVTGEAREADVEQRAGRRPRLRRTERRARSAEPRLRRIESCRTADPARVVVTGVGAITAQGPTADALWEGVRDGRVAIRAGRAASRWRATARSSAARSRRRSPPEHEYRHPDGLPRAGDRLRAEGRRGGGRAVRRGRVRATPGGALGRRRSAPATRACSPARSGTGGGSRAARRRPRAAAARQPAGGRRGAGGRVRLQGAGALGQHRLRGERERDRLRAPS